jgi:hypothetical protein
MDYGYLQRIRVINSLVLTIYGVGIDQLLLDKKRLDWLESKENRVGKVLLPPGCIERNPDNIRDAIDDAMAL